MDGTLRIAALEAIIDQQAEELRALRVENARLHQRVEELLALVKKRKSRRRRRKKRRRSGGANPENSPSDTSDTQSSTEPSDAADDASKDGDTPDESDAPGPTPLDARPKPPEPDTAEEPVETTHNPVARNPIPDHLPAHEQPVWPLACSCGCTDLPIIDEVLHTRIDLVPAYLRKVETRRKVGKCSQCGARVAAPTPADLYARAKLTPTFGAWIIYQKYVLHMPLDRIKHEIERMGLVLSDGTLNRYLDRTASMLEKVDGVHWKELMAQRVLQIDATSLTYMLKDVGTEHGLLDQFCSGNLVVFLFSQTKHGEDLEAKLEQFKGTIVADAEHRMNGLMDRDDVTEAGCNAHGCRKFIDAKSAHPLASEGAAFLSAAFAAECEARESNLSGKRLLDWRQERIKPLFDDLRRWIDIVEPHTTPTCPLGKACRYYQNHWTALTRFLDDPDVPIDNNDVERTFQHTALGRNAWRMTGSVDSAHRAAVFMGIVATCRRMRVDPLAYLIWAVKRLGTLKKIEGHTAADSTPAAFKKALEERDRSAGTLARHAA